MNSRLIVLCIFVAVLGRDFACAAKVTTESLVKKQGYPFEEHTVETQDGYLLQVHRIPYSPGQQPSDGEKRPVIFLMHGLSCSSSEFVMSRKALAYLLADAGYDVWMGNARGNVYSRKHDKLNPDGFLSKFWDYTWHEIGTIDLPAMIDYIRNQTGHNQIDFVGHSQGTTNFMVMSSLNETYQNYIRSAHLMTPLGFVEKLSKRFLEIASKVISLLNPLPNLAGNVEFKPNGTITKLAGAALCNDEPRELCSNILFLLTGFNNITVDPSIMSDVLATVPAGASIKCFLHYFQLHDSNEFQQYDYGLLGNLRRYNNRKPPQYPLEKITVPVHMYWGEEDELIHKPDIDRLANKLGNVQSVHGIDGAAHQYPTFGIGVDEKVYKLILSNLASSN